MFVQSHFQRARHHHQPAGAASQKESLATSSRPPLAHPATTHGATTCERRSRVASQKQAASNKSSTRRAGERRDERPAGAQEQSSAPIDRLRARALTKQRSVSLSDSSEAIDGCASNQQMGLESMQNRCGVTALVNPSRKRLPTFGETRPPPSTSTIVRLRSASLSKLPGPAAASDKLVVSPVGAQLDRALGCERDQSQRDQRQVSQPAQAPRSARSSTVWDGKLNANNQPAQSPRSLRKGCRRSTASCRHNSLEGLVSSLLSSSSRPHTETAYARDVARSAGRSSTRSLPLARTFCQILGWTLLARLVGVASLFIVSLVHHQWATLRRFIIDCTASCELARRPHHEPTAMRQTSAANFRHRHHHQHQTSAFELHYEPPLARAHDTADSRRYYPAQLYPNPRMPAAALDYSQLLDHHRAHPGGRAAFHVHQHDHTGHPNLAPPGDAVRFGGEHQMDCEKQARLHGRFEPMPTTRPQMAELAYSTGNNAPPDLTSSAPPSRLLPALPAIHDAFANERRSLSCSHQSHAFHDTGGCAGPNTWMLGMRHTVDGLPGQHHQRVRYHDQEGGGQSGSAANPNLCHSGHNGNLMANNQRRTSISSPTLDLAEHVPLGWRNEPRSESIEPPDRMLRSVPKTGTKNHLPTQAYRSNYYQQSHHRHNQSLDIATCRYSHYYMNNNSSSNNKPESKSNPCAYRSPGDISTFQGPVVSERRLSSIIGSDSELCKRSVAVISASSSSLSSGANLVRFDLAGRQKTWTRADRTDAASRAELNRRRLIRQTSSTTSEASSSRPTDSSRFVQTVSAEPPKKSQGLAAAKNKRSTTPQDDDHGQTVCLSVKPQAEKDTDLQTVKTDRRQLDECVDRKSTQHANRDDEDRQSQHANAKSLKRNADLGASGKSKSMGYAHSPKRVASALGKVSLAGAKRRLGFKQNRGLNSLSVHRSEEIFPFEASEMLARQYTSTTTTGSVSLNESCDLDLGSRWLNRFGTESPDPKMCFVEGLGTGQIASRQALVSPYMGDIQVSLSDQRGVLEVEVIRARHLQTKPYTKRLPSIYVKVYLMKNKKCLAKFKTAQRSQTLDPLYQEAFIFRDDYSDCVLQIIVWGDYGKNDRKSLMGIVQIHLNTLDMSNVVVGWYKLFNAPSMVAHTSMASSSKSLRQTLSTTKLEPTSAPSQQR